MPFLQENFKRNVHTPMPEVSMEAITHIQLFIETLTEDTCTWMLNYFGTTQERRRQVAKKL